MVVVCAHVDLPRRAHQRRGSLTVVLRYPDTAGKHRKKSFREPTAAGSRKAAKDYAARLRSPADGRRLRRPLGARVERLDHQRGAVGRAKGPFGEVARQWLDEANPTKPESGWARDEIVIRRLLTARRVLDDAP